MIRNPEFKVGDLVVKIDGVYQDLSMDFFDPGHFPMGAVGRVSRVGPEPTNQVFVVRTTEDGKKDLETTPFNWYSPRDSIHPANDDPYEEAK